MEYYSPKYSLIVFLHILFGQYKITNMDLHANSKTIHQNNHKLNYSFIYYIHNFSTIHELFFFLFKDQTIPNTLHVIHNKINFSIHIYL